MRDSSFTLALIEAEFFDFLHRSAKRRGCQLPWREAGALLAAQFRRMKLLAGNGHFSARALRVRHRRFRVRHPPLNKTDLGRLNQYLAATKILGPLA